MHNQATPDGLDGRRHASQWRAPSPEIFFIKRQGSGREAAGNKAKNEGRQPAASVHPAGNRQATRQGTGRERGPRQESGRDRAGAALNPPLVPVVYKFNLVS